MTRKNNSNFLDYLKILVFFFFIASFFLPFLKIAPFFSLFNQSVNLVLISLLVVKNIFTHEDMFLIAAGVIFLFSLYLAPLFFIILLPFRKYIRIDPLTLKKYLMFFIVVIYALYLFICYSILPPSPSLLPVAVIFMIPVTVFLFIILYYLETSFMIIENSLVCFMQPASYVLFWNFFITGGRNYMYGAYAYFLVYAVLFIVSFVQVILFIRRKASYSKL